MEASNAGCGSTSRTISATVYPSLSTVIPDVNTPVCEGSAIYFTATNHPASTYSWTGPNGMSSTSRSHSINTAIPGLHTGVYTFNVSNPACGSMSTTLSLMVGGSLQSVSLSSNSPVCTGSALHLSSVNIPNAVMQWTGPSGFLSTSYNSTINNVQLNHSGDYTYFVSSPGCGSLTQTIQTSVHAPVSATALSNSPVCQDQTLSLSSGFVSGSTYAWYGPNGFTSTLQNPAITNVRLNAAGIYTVVHTQPGCGSSSATVSVSVGTSLNGITLSTNSPVCANSNLGLSALNRSGITYNWAGPGGFNGSGATTVRNAVTTSNSGVYTLTMISAGCGCVMMTT